MVSSLNTGEDYTNCCITARAFKFKNGRHKAFRHTKRTEARGTQPSPEGTQPTSEWLITVTQAHGT